MLWLAWHLAFWVVQDKMAGLMQVDPGLERRFSTTLCLPDYSPMELAKIAGMHDCCA